VLLIYDNKYKKIIKMSFWNIEPEDWFRRGRWSFGGSRDDIFGQFDEMRREVERMKIYHI
jgi:hypothetical protein